MLSIKNKVSEMDTEKLKRLKTAIPRVLFIFISICMIVGTVIAILAGFGIVDNEFSLLPIIIILLAFGLADKIYSIIIFELTKRKLTLDSDEMDKTD